MRTIIAVNKADNEATGNDFTHGNWLHCIRWSRVRAEATGNPYVIAVARPGEKYAPLVAEVTADGVRPLSGGRYLRTKRMRQLYG
ncbi:hypothetical protein [Vreelandella utahensis]|uniref:hypothetical protein n=1 Tax=Vreelandella halophila TaxID=86177 RepID=UPI0009867DBD|nr:hypothetical protein [Halomonas utahensis]